MQYTYVEDVGVPDYLAQVVEDEDGFRILLIQSVFTPLPKSVWSKAFAAGVVMILIGEDEFISTEDFSLGRKDSSAGWILPVPRPIGPTPSYRDLVRVEDEQKSKDPLEDCRFVHLHTHTEYSALDGLTNITEAIDVISQDPEGGGALGSSDHGNCASHPQLQEECDKANIKPVFGMEAYFVPDRFRRSTSWHEFEGVKVDLKHLSEVERKKAERKSDAQEVKNEYTHLTLWAQTQQGLRNLWAMSTEAYRDGLYDGKPRLDWDTLTRLNEGVICGTGCLRGPVSRPLISEGGMEEARQNLLRLHEIFGDRLYVEIHANALEDQLKVNRHLVEFCEQYQIQPLAAVDSHYPTPEHQVVHKTWLAMQTGKTLTEDTTLFSGDQDYHLKTAAEVVSSLDYLDADLVARAMQNTVEIARSCQARVGGEVSPPTYSKVSIEHPDPVQRDIERLTDICLDNWQKVVGKRNDEQVYMDRFEREMALLVDKRFCGYYLVVWDYVQWAKDNGCLVGPGRGSGGGSLVAYLANIVEIDPVDADLIFERFLTEGRTSLPDFDIDFPTSWRERIIAYIKERWGEDYVANIGTVSRLRSLAAVNDTVRVIKSTLPYEIPFTAIEQLKEAIREADRSMAGKHLPWDEFCAQYSDLVEPMIEAYPDLFAVVDRVIDRVKTYGKHAAGVVISTDAPLTDLPMRLVEDKKTKEWLMVTQFDMGALEILGYVKFDILTLRTLDTLQGCIDLIEEHFGVRIDPYAWKEEYEDPQVWDEVSSGRTLGLFQIETAAGTRLTRRMQPRNLQDLAAVMTVVRPGPMRSGLTESYLRRRNGLEPVTYLDSRMESFLGDTYGSIIYQEQILSTCMNLAGYDSTEADVVRKLLGKKQVEKVTVAGEEFVRRAIDWGQTDPQVANTLWDQMAEFAKYSFGKAHAFGYAVVGFYCAFFRFHYPVQFLVSALSTVDSDRVPEFIEDCRNNGYGIFAPDVNQSQVGFSARGVDLIFGLSQIKGIGAPAAEQMVSLAPYPSLDDFLERCVKFSGSLVDMGHVRLLVRAGAFDSIIPNRRVIEEQLEMEASGEAKRCVFKVEEPNPEHPFDLPCVYDWSNEPDPPLLPRGRGKDKTYEAKPPPKKCTVACRQYKKPEPVSIDLVAPYSKKEIMERERELMGVWITSSPFEAITPEMMDEMGILTAQEVNQQPATGDTFTVVGLVEEVKKRVDKTGQQYAFVKLNAVNGLVEGICFGSVWNTERDGFRPSDIRKDQLVAAHLTKNPRGYQFPAIYPLLDD